MTPSDALTDGDIQVIGIKLSETHLEASPVKAVYSKLSHLGAIRISGEDSEEFLQSQLTNDVASLSPDKAQITSYCSHQGKVIGVYFLVRDNPGWLLLCSADLVELTIQKLGKYIMRSKVKLADATDNLVLFGLAGAENCPIEAREKFWQLPGSSTRFLLLAPIQEIEATETSLKSKYQEISTAAWRLLDVLEGVPQLSQSLSELYLPQMLNLDQLAGISFSKGCYPGQEIVARTHYRGKVKRRMFAAVAQDLIDQDFPLEPGDDLLGTENQETVGRILYVSNLGQTPLLVQAVLSNQGSNPVSCSLSNPERTSLRILLNKQ